MDGWFQVLCRSSCWRNIISLPEKDLNVKTEPKYNSHRTVKYRSLSNIGLISDGLV